MPYSSTSDLPAYVQKLSAKAQRQWMHVFNSCHNDGKPDSKCFAMANGVAKSHKALAGDLTREELELVEAAKSYQYVDSWEYAEHQVEQTAAGYNPLGATSTKGCANCQFFVSPGRCLVVAGEISPTGISNFWQAEIAEAPEPIPVTIVSGDIGSLAQVGVAVAGDTSSASQEAAAPAARSSWVERTMGAIKSTLLEATATGWGVPTPGAAPPLGGPVQSRSPFSVVRQKDGRVRFFTFWSNNFKDREQEIFSLAAHKEYIEWADTTGRYPELWLWHTPGSRLGQVDWLDQTDGFVAASGLIDSSKEAIVEKLVEGGAVGASHGYVGLQAGNTIHMYRSHEVSVLPLEFAAVPTTSFNILTKECFAVPFTDQKKKFFKDLGIDDATVAGLEAQAAALSKSLKESGVAYKAEDMGLTPEPVAAPAATTTAAGAAAATTEPVANPAMVELVKSIGTLHEIMGTLATSVKAIDERTKSIVQTDDQRVAAALTPQVVPGTATTAASKAADNVVATAAAGGTSAADQEWFGKNILGPLGVPMVTNQA